MDEGGGKKIKKRIDLGVKLWEQQDSHAANLVIYYYYYFINFRLM